MEKLIKLNLNGREITVKLDPELTLLRVLRNQFGLTGTKFGCGIGYCGACTVIMDNEPIRSCMYKIGDAEGKSITTIEGLRVNGNLHPVQQAFLDHDALQCGYCTPGMIMNAYGLLLNNPEPTRQEVIDGMEDNLCRCSAYFRIIDAVQAAAREMKGGKKS